MKRLLLLTVLLFPLLASAADLGRLFYTQQQRQQLDFQGMSGGAVENSKRNYVIVNGIVQKKGGKRTVWVNGEAQEAGKANDRTPSVAPVTVPGKSQPIHLKVGQPLLLDSVTPEEK